VKKFFHHHGPASRCTLGDRELHCGDCFQIVSTPHPTLVIDTRIELGRAGWYLVGLTPSHADAWDGCEAREYPR